MRKNICIKLILCFAFLISMLFSNGTTALAISNMNDKSNDYGIMMANTPFFPADKISVFFDEITSLMNNNYNKFRGLYASADFKSLDREKVLNAAKKYLNDAYAEYSGDKNVDYSANMDWINSNFDEEFNTLNSKYKNKPASSDGSSGSSGTRPGTGNQPSRPGAGHRPDPEVGGQSGSESGTGNQSGVSDIAKDALTTFFKNLRGQLSGSFNSFKSNYVINNELNYSKIYANCNQYIVQQLHNSGSEQEVARFNMTQLSTEFADEYAALEDLYSSKLDKIERGEYDDVIDSGFFNSVENCRKDLLGNELADIMDELLMIVRIAVPILMIALITKDFVVAVTAGKEDDMKKAQSTAIKRLIIGVIIFLLPTIVNFILGIIGLSVGTCGIG